MGDLIVNNDFVIQCENLIKKYALYNKRSDRLVEALMPGKKSYHKDFYALNGVDFKIKKGEFVGFIGRNGAGKSTLLKVLTGVLSPTSGSVKVNGRVAALLELGAGFNPQYTGYENIYLNGAIMGFTREEMDEKVKEIVEFADIGDFINQPVKIYSSGMFVRLAFATAISVEPEILIVDEALAVGDVYFQLKCYKKFEEFKRKGKTILFVSHDQSSIIKYCDRAILLENGEILCDDTPKVAIDKYKKLLAETKKTDSDEFGTVARPKEHQADMVEWKHSYELNEKELEYGDHRAEIIDFGIFDQNGNLATNYQRNEVYDVKMKIKFHETVENPIFAITFKDYAGLEIAGTNTMQESIETGIYNKDDIVTVSFRVKFQFQNQPFFLSFGCTHFDNQGKLEVLHRLYDILCIQTFGAKVTNGFFDIDTKVTITK